MELEERGKENFLYLFFVGFLINWEKQDEIHRCYRFEGHKLSILVSNDEGQDVEKFLKCNWAI